MKYKAEDIYDEIEISCVVTCSKCLVPNETRGLDAMEASDKFFNLGWRRIKENLYCPKCASIKLK